MAGFLPLWTNRGLSIWFDVKWQRPLKRTIEDCGQNSVKRKAVHVSTCKANKTLLTTSWLKQALLNQKRGVKSTAFFFFSVKSLRNCEQLLGFEISWLRTISCYDNQNAPVDFCFCFCQFFWAIFSIEKHLLCTFLCALIIRSSTAARPKNKLNK